MWVPVLQGCGAPDAANDSCLSLLRGAGFNSCCAEILRTSVPRASYKQVLELYSQVHGSASLEHRNTNLTIIEWSCIQFPGEENKHSMDKSGLSREPIDRQPHAGSSAQPSSSGHPLHSTIIGGNNSFTSLVCTRVIHQTEWVNLPNQSTVNTFVRGGNNRSSR